MTHTLDPIQGLIDYVNEIKPFHTKILEVAVAYAQNDDVDIIFTEEFNIDVSLFWPALADDDDVPIRNCPEGWGEVYDRPSQYIVVDANISPQTVSLDGDQSAFFAEGTRFEIREPTTDTGSPSGVQQTPRVYEMFTLSTAYDGGTNTTILGATELGFDFLGSPIVFGSPLVLGSPQFPLPGSPPFIGSEFYFPPYPAGSVSNGDVFIIHDVVETKKLVIRTRPTPFYVLIGSPVGSGSPYIAGSPLPGSPKIVTGSPAVYQYYGSPNNAGNTITIKGITVAEFNYGTEVQIRNASETTLNKTYNVLTAVDLGGSPELIQLTMIDPILVDTVNDGELVLTPIGFSGGSFCSDVPPELAVTHWMEDLQQTWRFAESPLEDNFQLFILEANSTDNTYVVEGDVRGLMATYGNNSPNDLAVSIQHAVTTPYIPFGPRYGSPIYSGSPFVVGSPINVDTGLTVTLSANNGTATVQSITYDSAANRSTLQMDSVSVDTPTGWITYVFVGSPVPAPPEVVNLTNATIQEFSTAPASADKEAGYEIQDNGNAWSLVNEDNGAGPPTFNTLNSVTDWIDIKAYVGTYHARMAKTGGAGSLGAGSSPESVWREIGVDSALWLLQSGNGAGFVDWQGLIEISGDGGSTVLDSATITLETDEV